MEEKIRKESLDNSLKECAATSAMLGFGDNFVSPYIIAMNAKPYQIGLLTSLPNLFSPFSQIIGSRVMNKVSRKNILSFSTLFQALMWLPIIFSGYLYLKGFVFAPTFLIFSYAFYVFFGGLGGPAWVSWMGDLVKEEELGNYFGMRNAIGTIISIISIVVAGFILDAFKFLDKNFVFLGFSIIFFLALIFRLIGRSFLLKQYEPKFKLEKEQYFSFISFIKRLPKTNFGRFVILLSFMNFSVNVVAPYFNLYIFKYLKFSYTQYILLNVSTSIAFFIFYPLWGRLSDKFSNTSILKFSSILVSLVSLLWFPTIFLSPLQSFYYLLLVNFFSGFSWAAFGLTTNNFFYLTVSPPKRGLCFSYSNILYGLSIVIGTQIGSGLLNVMQNSYINPIMLLAFISGILRMICGFLFIIFVEEPRIVYRSLLPEFLEQIKKLKSLIVLESTTFIQEFLKIPNIIKIIFKKKK
ncbi:MAG: MFS transporter [Minisyncoccia bacterium]